MLITDLQPIKSDLSRIKEIPDMFFRNLEKATAFDNSLFPKWLVNKGKLVVFKENTELRNKFRAIFDKYKAIKDKTERQKIIEAYFNTNRVLELCNNENNITYYELTDLDESIRSAIDSAFLYLYNSALKHPDFESYVKDNIKKTLKTFAIANGLEVCPFCGLELLLQLEGQARLPLDHWLNKNRFPFASVNFDNLIPIGEKCNSNGVKGSKNVLKDIKAVPKRRAFYPYSTYSGISINISCKEIPNIDNLIGEWDFSISPKEKNEKDAFESWNYIFNISTRYSSYFFDILIPNWKSHYICFIRNEEDKIVHAQTVDEFKENLKQWNRSFKVKTRHAALIYQRFINYLISEAPEDYLVGLVENFKSQESAHLI